MQADRVDGVESGHSAEVEFSERGFHHCTYVELVALQAVFMSQVPVYFTIRAAYP